MIVVGYERVYATQARLGLTSNENKHPSVVGLLLEYTQSEKPPRPRFDRNEGHAVWKKSKIVDVNEELL
jgi:hypothetical protein